VPFRLYSLLAAVEFDGVWGFLFSFVGFDLLIESPIVGEASGPCVFEQQRPLDVGWVMLLSNENFAQINGDDRRCCILFCHSHCNDKHHHEDQ
jgi:hypothetical protein